jgi:hypothetical protein
MTGHGIYKYFNGDVYEGKFQDGWRNGFGKMTYANGELYEGEWKKGKRDGEGKLFYKNGDKFVGKWHKDKRDGEGRLFDANGNLIEEGEYEDDAAPFDITNTTKLDKVYETYTTKLDNVINSENSTKFQAKIKEFYDKLPDQSSYSKLSTYASYALYLIPILSMISYLIFAGDEDTCKFGANDKNTYLFCNSLKIVATMLKGQSSALFTTLDTTVELFNSFFGTWANFYAGMFAVGISGLFIMVLYGSWVFINSSQEERKSLTSRHTRKKK